MARKIARLGLTGSIILLASSGFASSKGDLPIISVIAGPAALPASAPECLELSSPCGRKIDSRTINTGDDDANHHRFDSDLLILPAEYLTLASGSLQS